MNDRRRDVEKKLRRTRGRFRRVAIELALECRDCESEEIVWEKASAILSDREDSGRVRFNPMIVVMIIQAAVAIWKLLKEMGVLNRATVKSTTEMVDEIAGQDDSEEGEPDVN